jgi:hypothetical protein
MLALAVVSAPPSPIQLQVDVSALAAMPSRQLRAMTREAAEIWRPQGVALIWVTGEHERIRPPARQMLKVVDASSAAGSDGCSRLGSVEFLDGHLIPELTLVLSVERVARLVENTPFANRRVRDWPPAARSELAGRALGRVLAHEIGHYLFAWRTHTDHGLMRRSFRSDSLIEPDRRGFEVPAVLTPRLRARLAQLAEPGRTIVEIW